MLKSSQLDADIRNKVNDLDKLCIKNGVVSVKEYFDDLRCEVDLATEQQIEAIRKNNEQLLKQIDQYEKECLLKIEDQNVDINAVNDIKKYFKH